MITETKINRFKLARYLLAGMLLSHAAVVVADSRLQYTVDHDWPELPLPNNWAMGEIGGMEVDDRDHVWVIQRPRTLAPWEVGAAADPPRSECCVAAPPVIEFDPQGKVVRSWGGPGEGYEWPMVEHGISVDHKGNVWVGGSSTRVGPNGEPPDGMVLKFTADGEFLMQIGSAGASGGSLDPEQLSGAADIAVHAPTNEVFIADGYGNHRVIVFDADTGEFKRMWGAYGRPPTDNELGPYDPTGSPAAQFRTAHCITLARDGTVFLCDRDNNRVQVFTSQGKFLHEYVYQPETLPPGTVGHLSLWPPETGDIMAITDLGNFKIRLVNRKDGRQIGSFGHFGNFAGQLNRVHQADFDSAGNIYTAEAAGKRIQRWVRSNQ
jgi:hypothetical protein